MKYWVAHGEVPAVRGFADIVLAGHAGGGRQHPMGAYEIGALPDALSSRARRIASS